MHDEFDGDIRESEVFQVMMKKIPIDIIKSFFQIELKSYVPFFPFGSSHEVNNFLQNNRVIRSSPTRQKTTLIGANNIIKNRSQSVNQNFGDNFVSNVAQADRSEIFVSVRSVNLRNECNESI